MITDTHLDFFSVFTFLGVFQGLILAFFLIRSGSRKRIGNIYQGMLLLTLSLGIFEEFLNESGYIVQVLFLTNITEPFNFVFAPLFFLYIKRTLKPEFERKDLLHFLIFLFWLGYMMFSFTQPEAFKYNSYLSSKHPDWQYLEVSYPHDPDPLGLGSRVNLWTAIHFVIYLALSIRFFLGEVKRSGLSLLKTDNATILSLRNVFVHFILICIIFLFVKLNFQSDLGDKFISTYISFMIITTALRILNNSASLNETTSFMTFPLVKYKKSTLDDDSKSGLLKKIEHEMSANRYYLSHMASLGELSRNMKASTHHVSQVINETLKMNFFEYLASYRVEEAKKILTADTEKKITVEDLAERVGYNSKSAFNNAFKKHTGKTPSEFRDTI